MHCRPDWVQRYFDLYSQSQRRSITLVGLLQKPNTRLRVPAELSPIPKKRSKMPDMSQRLTVVFAVIVTIILGASLSEMVIQSWQSWAR
jgi:hypothetical protein